MSYKELKNAKEVLNNKGVILYPTDTVWGIGCDATDEKAVQKVYEIKRRKQSKSLIILVNSITMLEKYVQKIPQQAINIIKNTQKPTTIIYQNPKGLAKNTIAKDNTIAIRIVREPFCEKLIREFGKPIVSTSANISHKDTPKSFSEISDAILNSVDYIVSLQREKITYKTSTIMSVYDDKIQVIRE